jgi:hypothetical protein
MARGKITSGSTASASKRSVRRRANACPSGRATTIGSFSTVRRASPAGTAPAACSTKPASISSRAKAAAARRSWLRAAAATRRGWPLGTRAASRAAVRRRCWRRRPGATCRRGPAAAACATAGSSSTRCSSRRTAGHSAAPAGLSATWRWLRTNSGTPRRSSSCRMAMTQRRLRHVQPFRGAAEVQFLGQHGKLLQQAKSSGSLIHLATGCAFGNLLDTSQRRSRYFEPGAAAAAPSRPRPLTRPAHGRPAMSFNRRSKNITEGVARAPNRSMYYGMGYQDGDFGKPMIGVANGHSTITPCNSGLQKLADAAVVAELKAIRRQPADLRHAHHQRRHGHGHRGHEVQPGEPRGHRRLRRDLRGRPVDGRRAGHRRLRQEHARRHDGHAARQRAGIYVYGGTILPGRYKGEDLNIVSVFEAVGQFSAGKMSEEDFCQIERAPSRAAAAAAACTPPTP